MRTTLTLNDDVSMMLEKPREESVSFEEAVNRALPQGFHHFERPAPNLPCTLPSFDLGKSFVPLDDTAEVLGVAEGEDYR